MRASVLLAVTAIAAAAADGGWELRLGAGVAPGVSTVDAGGGPAQDLDAVAGIDLQLALLAHRAFGDDGWGLVAGPAFAARTVGGSRTTPAARDDVSLSTLSLRMGVGPSFSWRGWRWEAMPVVEVGAALGELRRTPGTPLTGGSGAVVGGGLATAVGYAIDADWTIGLAIGLQAFRAQLDFPESDTQSRTEVELAGYGLSLALTAGWDF